VVRDINAFFDPAGGTGYGNFFHSSGLIGLGAIFAFDPWGKGLFGLSAEQLFINPSEKTAQARIMGRQMMQQTPVYRETLQGRRIGAAGHSAMMGTRRLPAFGPEPVAGHGYYARTTNDQLSRQSLNQALAKNKAKYASARRYSRAVGWTFLISGLFEIAQAIATPGIAVSDAAKRRDAMMFADERAIDSPRAYTQRQRALLAIHDSQMGVRNVIGNEAQFLHR
jgi:hypothetical protein